MATKIRRSLVVLLSALGAACGGDPDTMGSPNSASTLDEAISENGRHADACRRAESIAGMLDDVDRHELVMNDLMVRMANDSDEMRAQMMETHGCTGQGMDHMSQGLVDANAEVAVHSKQMHAAETLGAGHFECAVHAHELRQMLQSMRADLSAMSCE